MGKFEHLRMVRVRVVCKYNVFCMDDKKQRKQLRRRREKPEFEQRLLDLRRVTRVVKGGRRFRFRATVAIGDRHGRVGVGVAKGSDVTDAISKAYASAKKSMVTVTLSGATIPHDIEVKLASARVLLKPAGEGRGLIAGGAVRTVAELAGIGDITSKSLGSSNKLNVARATVLALSRLRNVEKKQSTKKEEENVVEKVSLKKGKKIIKREGKK